MGDVADFERTDRPGTAQPPPVPVLHGASIHDLVMADLAQRKAFGLRKYGTLLQVGNGRNPLADLYEELLDAACYAKQALLEWEAVQARLVARED